MNSKNYYLRMGLILISFVLSSVGFSQTVYTFTPSGATGNVGPTQGMADIEYTGTTLDGAVTVTGGIQYWVVPTTGMYSIEAFGGQGYGPFGGRGAHIYGEFMLTAGTTLKVLVGQQAGHYFDWPNTGYNHQYGGGGGSFITDIANTPFVVAGGGGGNHGTSWNVTCDAQITTAGAAGTNGSILGNGGTAGSGGNDASSADGGGGLLGNGLGIAGGQAFVNGGLGGIDEGTGGFGCGGGTSSWNNYRGGGGGGYSGGGAANNSGSCCPSGGGGGSYNNGTNPVNLAGVQLGDGMIVISSLCAPTMGTLVADVVSLPTITADCSSTPAPPTATNDCAGGIEGTPDVTFPITTVGTTVVTWTYTDGTNTVSQTEDVTINPDVTAPVVDVPVLTDMTDDCYITPAYPTATDACNGSIVGVPDASFPITALGLTVVTWSFDDGNGNISTQTQNINVNADVTPPVLDNPSLVNLSGQCLLTPATPTATDLCAGTISGVADVTFPLSTQGVTVITWTFDDGSGNTVTQTQNITLNDVAPPALDVSTLTDYIGCEDATPPTPTATDYCAGVLNGTPDVTFPITAAGPTTVTWTYDDGNGNTISQTQDVYVQTLDLNITVNEPTITANAVGMTYQWIDCDTGLDIAGETNQSFTATDVTGNYAVTISDGICTDVSACTVIDFSGVSELNYSPISIYPNPSIDGMFSIDFDGEIDQILVIDALGRIIEVPTNIITGKVDGSSLSTGNYTVRVITNDIVYTQNVMIVR